MAGKPSQAKSKPRSYILISLLLVAMTLIVFWQVLDHGFVAYDDDEYVTANPHLRAGLTMDGIKWAFTSIYTSNWHPVTWVSYLLDWELWRLDAYGYHLTNVVLHLINVLLLFALLSRMTGSLWKSAFVSALFAVHPLRVESVAWVAERKDMLSTLFWLLTVLAYIRYVGRPRVSTYLPVLLIYALGLMSKPMLVTLPFTLLLLDYWPLRRLSITNGAEGAVSGRWVKLVGEKAPLLVMAAASSVITYYAQRQGGSLDALGHLQLGTRAANALVAYVSYVWKMLWPKDLAVLYPHPTNTLPVWEVVASGALLVIASLLVILAARRMPYLAVGWFWYLSTLVPVIGLVQVGVQAIADRYTYAPLIGLFVMVAWGIPDLLQSVSRAGGGPGRIGRVLHSVGLPVICCIVLAALMICARVQAGYWRSSISLFRHALDVTDNNYILHHNLAAVLESQGELDGAVAHFTEAIRIKPDDVSSMNDLAGVLSAQGRVDEAIAQYRNALKLQPDDVLTHSDLGAALARQGKTDEAVHHFAEAVRIDPDYAPAYYNWGVALAARGRWEKAAERFAKAVSMKPDYTAAYNNLAYVLYMSGKYEEAWEQVRLCRRHGGSPSPQLIELLSRMMPDPEAVSP